MGKTEAKLLVRNDGEQECEEVVERALQRLAREQLKHKLLADIRIDIEICRLEGWDYKQYLYELKEIIDHFLTDW